MKPFNFTVPTDKMPGGWHGSYCTAYSRIFDSLKNTRGAVIEIGVDGGGSLMAYHDWFSNAFVLGMDISPAPGLQWSDRLKHVQRNAYDPRCVEETRHMLMTLNRQPMVVIDDGPHTLGTQEFFVENYLPLLAPDGIGVVEDVQSADHIAKLYAKLPQGFTGYGIDLRWADDRYDSQLFVAERKNA